MYLKNIASQKVGFVMVDKTDFATPETGISPAGAIRKDGGASAAVSNTVSELTNGQYVLTLAQAETNADLIQLRFHDSAASCATQFITIKTEGNKINSILADTGTLIDVRNDTTSILNDTRTLSNATYGLDALETIVSQTLAALTGIGGGTSALSVTLSTILANSTSILADTITLSNATYGLDALESLCSQILEDTTSILVDTKTTIPGTITTLENRSQSILADTITLSNADYGLNALESLCSQILEDTDALSGDSGAISAVKGIVDSILVDTAAISNINTDDFSAAISTTLANSTSILADTVTLSNAAYGLDALETITSDILEALDSVTAGPIASILVDTNATLDNKIDSILADTKEINSQCDSILADTITLSNATYGLNALESLCSQILVDTGTDGIILTAAGLDADAATEIATAVWAKTGAVTTIATELLLERLYEMINDKMIVTEASGDVALRNIADDADIATGNVQDLGATTVREGFTWA